MVMNPGELGYEPSIPTELQPGPSGPEPFVEEGGLPGDLFPPDEEEHAKLVKWCNAVFTAADDGREHHAERWRRWYKLFRSYIPEKKGDWRSRVFVPICFWVIQTIAPRLVAQLPKGTCTPLGPEDVVPAQKMELMLERATEKSDLYIQLVAAYIDALTYGTAILKTYRREDVIRYTKTKEVMAPMMGTRDIPVIDPETGEQMMDMNGQPMFDSEQLEIGQVSSGQQRVRETAVVYDGPAAECVDLFNFWVAPEADDIDTARYVIHRTYKSRDYVKRRIDEGIYQLPFGMTLDELVDTQNDPNLERLDSIGMAAVQGGNDPTRKDIELLEIHTDDGRLILMANRKAILRCIENPYDHGEKPFVRIVDHYVPHEFYGIGEIEYLEGLQDFQNALTNSRIDNIRLIMNAMFAVNVNNVEDIADLNWRPGGIIRLKGDFKPGEVVERIQVGDVTQSAYEEAAANQDAIEKASGVSAYQMGLDSPSLNNTATGVAIIQEQGASRFGLKSKIIELTGLRRLYRHYGTIIQQFSTQETLVRLAGVNPQTGQPNWGEFTPESLQGAMDYSIQSESSTQTQSMRVDKKMNLLQTLAEYSQFQDPMTGLPLIPASGVKNAVRDVVEAMGEKDVERYLEDGSGMAPPGLQGPGMLPPPQPGQLPMPLPPLTPEQEMAAAGGNAAAGTPGSMAAERQAELLAQRYDQAADTGLGGY